jgi:hypothetical protein
MEILSPESLSVLAGFITFFWVSVIALAVGCAIDGAKSKK